MKYNPTEFTLHSTIKASRCTEVTSPKQSELIQFSQPYLKKSLSAYRQALDEFDRCSNSAMFSRLVCPYAEVEFRIKGKTYSDTLLRKYNNSPCIKKVYDDEKVHLSYFTGIFSNIEFHSYYTIDGWVTDFRWIINDWSSGKVGSDRSWTSFIYQFEFINKCFKIDMKRAVLIKLIVRFDAVLVPTIQDSVKEILARAMYPCKQVHIVKAKGRI